MISKELKDYLFTFGLSYKYRGFPWLMIALEIIERDVMALGMIKDTIYLQIAEDVNTNIACIERNFRTLSEIAFNTNKTGSSCRCVKGEIRMTPWHARIFC